MANLLPLGRQSFTDDNGNPLVGGRVFFYIPNTSTLKDTWQDKNLTTLNTNPVILDARGEATIWGTGTYRQVLQDQFGNQIWDELTQDPEASLAGDFVDQTFLAPGDFTPGTTSQLTLSDGFGTAANLWIDFDGVPQHGFTLDGNVLSFDSPIPVGISAVYVKGGISIPLSVPASQSVTPSTIAPGTGGFWSDGSPVGQIWRFQDRMLMGGATVQDGKKNPSVRTWVGVSANGFMTYFDSRSQLESISTIGGLGAAFASRSSDSLPSEQGTIGVGSFVLNDNSDNTDLKPVWGYYAHAVQQTNNLFTACMEVDIANVGTLVECNSYAMGQQGVTVSHWVGVGGETAQSGIAVNPASLAIGIVSTGPRNALSKTGALFDKGIVFQADCLSGCDGNFLGGVATAVEMARGHQLVWRYSGGVNAIGGLIRSDNANAATQTRLLFGVNNFSIAGVKADAVTEVPLLVVVPDQNAVNYLQLSPGEAGSHPVIGVQGSDANIDLALETLGAGLLKFGFYTAASISATGYISVKTLDGTVRRLLVG
jgi:hypothetical protein